ncbi:hypothetical protein [Rhizobium sp. Leaf383]|uniref:hypothetical protein n=1 Tax=Rhizobium sp. Leaf383 TaxID=1736357 RepID=UPI0007140A74|nr:hypothetical protein [Rhizobium sp. Leaf383]KQS84325.1 hypothetical protein ASG58_21380 [Rhizobium sp. Leaf383]
MAFGARQEADGKWRLCLRKGRTITGTPSDEGRLDFEFASQRRAKACADELNETFWDRYRRLQTGDHPAPEWAHEMIDTIRKHVK